MNTDVEAGPTQRDWRGWRDCRRFAGKIGPPRVVSSHNNCNNSGNRNSRGKHGCVAERHDGRSAIGGSRIKCPVFVRRVSAKSHAGAMSALGQKRTLQCTRRCPLCASSGHGLPRVSVSGGFRKACSSDIPPHQNRLVFRPACSPSRDGSRVEPACSRRQCKQSVAVQQWQPSCDASGAWAPRWPVPTRVQAQRQ